MNIVVCVDDKRGVLFNGRRQSSDKEVINKLLQVAEGKKIYANDFSGKLLGEYAEINNNFLNIANEEEFCFVENVMLLDYMQNIKKVYLFKWNRSYPADFIFDFPLEQNFYLCSTEDFKGNSHDNITLEVWGKCD